MPSSDQNSNGNHSPRYDVAVVGFGPAGAVAACWLGLFGVKTLVVDKSRTIWQIPRAIALDHEIMRVFQNLGTVEKVLPHTAPFPPSQHFGAQGQLIRTIDVVAPPYPLAYPPTLVFTQPAVEAILRDRVAELKSVNVQLGQEVVNVQQDGDTVRLTIESDTQNQWIAQAKYVIACDGASSRIRQLLGINLVDLNFDEPWMVVDVIVTDAALDKLPRTAAQYCNPERPTTFIIGPGNHRRWEIMLLPDEDPRAMEEENNVWNLLSPWVGPSDGKLWRASSYRFHALLADPWRKGCVFLAGDAAHQQPPFIGQGMCQGIRDVTNLCWKIQTVLSGLAGEPVLNSYEMERSRHVRTLTSRIKAIGHHICERDPEAARLRDKTLLDQGGGVAPVVTRQEIVPPLEAGLLSSRTDRGRGSLFPQPWICTGKSGVQRLDDLTGFGWRLIWHGGHPLPDIELPSWIKVVVIGGKGLQEQDGVVAQHFELLSAIGVVVRPDHYVYASIRHANDVEPTVRELKEALTGSNRIVDAAVSTSERKL